MTPTTPLAGRTLSAVTVTAPGAEGLAAGPFDQTFMILPLEVTGIDRLEVVLVYALNNLREPPMRFPR